MAGFVVASAVERAGNESNGDIFFSFRKSLDRVCSCFFFSLDGRYVSLSLLLLPSSFPPRGVWEEGRMSMPPEEEGEEGRLVNFYPSSLLYPLMGRGGDRLWKKWKQDMEDGRKEGKGPFLWVGWKEEDVSFPSS